MTKGTPHSLFIADATRGLLTGEIELAFVDSMPVRGRAEEIRVWAPAAEERAEAASPSAGSAPRPA
jgi:hypothetical protein